jgi:hypothetical protein
MLNTIGRLLSLVGVVFALFEQYHGNYDEAILLTVMAVLVKLSVVDGEVTALKTK